MSFITKFLLAITETHTILMIMGLKITTLRPPQVRAPNCTACRSSGEMCTANKARPTHSTWQLNFIWTFIWLFSFRTWTQRKTLNSFRFRGGHVTKLLHSSLWHTGVGGPSVHLYSYRASLFWWYTTTFWEALVPILFQWRRSGL